MVLCACARVCGCMCASERERERGSMIDTVYFESCVIYCYINCTSGKPSAIIVINIML
jgi:hypothetical protein